MHRLLMSKGTVMVGVMVLAIIAPYALLHPLSLFALGTAGYCLILMVMLWSRDRENQRSLTEGFNTTEENQTARERLQTLIAKDTPIQRTPEEEAIYEKLRKMNVLRPPQP